VPTSSIDTFFACSLIVSVVIVTMSFLTATMQTQISNMQDLNQQDYLQNIADHVVTSCGNPKEWGSADNAPTSFGLSTNNTDRLYEMDVDKITRLNSLNEFALSYPEVFIAARLNNIAFGVTVEQILNLNVELLGNLTSENVTKYTFQVSVNQYGEPIKAHLNCYVIAKNFLSTSSNGTSDSGVGQISVEIPNSSNGSSTLVVFARPTFDDRFTTYSVFPFEHLSDNSQENTSYLMMSPLNYTLNVHTYDSNTVIENAYALTYQHQSNLTLSSNGTSSIPEFVDKSPTVLLLQCRNDTTSFNEWTVYPQVPLKFGVDFSFSEINAFAYLVTINGVLYKLTLLFGDVIN
jgi:hypothetical protein